jgi:Co/Zn/Cd efflux system component
MDCAADEQVVRMRLEDVDAVERLTFDLNRRTVTAAHRGDRATIKLALDALEMGAVEVATGKARRTRPDRGSGAEKRALGLALAINLPLFGAEFGAGVLADSIGLVADSLDMLADASVYALSLLAVGHRAQRKRRLARASGYLQLTLAVAGLLEVVRRALGEEPLPDARIMVAIAALALVGNVATLMLLRRVRSEEFHLQASWIFTANDIRVNALVILAALAVAITDSEVPDLLAGGVIFAIVANGARRILALSR